jgi:hypothetical protein
MNPGRITTRTQLIEIAREIVPSRQIKRALQEGKVVVLGGFNPIPRTQRPGWVIVARSRHGRSWLVAVIPDDLRHEYRYGVFDKISAADWVGKVGQAGWSPYDGDCPIIMAKLQEAALEYIP